ncbi:hypothetical protein [Arthrobacter agilis]|uniref:hypothetical protein n=1 Tax=Arthrobacter agilis TaxID=37921 RepID=UPI0016429F6D
MRLVEGEVRELIRRRGLDPSRQASQVQVLVNDAVADYDERSMLGVLPPLGRLDVARKQVYDAVAGFGALQPFLDDPTVEEVWINAPAKIPFMLFRAHTGNHERSSTILRHLRPNLL